MKYALHTLSLLLALAGFSAQANPSHGLDLLHHDPAVRAQDDLFRAANGGWLQSTEIPADKSTYGAFAVLRDLSDARVRTIVEELAASKQEAGSLEFKIGNFYSSFMDTAAIERAGLKPVQPLLSSIQNLKSLPELSRWMGENFGRAPLPFQMWVDADAKEPGVNRLAIVQGGLGLPDRDYYLDQKDARMAATREAYLSYLQVLARAAGEKDAARAAKQVMAIETRLAALHWPAQENRDPVKTYNAMNPAQLQALAPQLDWTALFQAAGLPAIDQLSVAQPSALQGLSKLLADVPLADWKLYLKLHLLDAHAPVLPRALRDAHFALHGKALSGASQELPRWQQAIAAVNEALGEAVGQRYVARHFPPEAKARMEAMVAQLMAAYRESIDGLSWMSPETRARAQEKLSKFVTKIGYPDTWRSYAELEVRTGDALGNRLRSGRAEWLRVAQQAGKPVDRMEWGTTPQTVNAFYNPTRNDITFPAAILQPPFFDLNADDAVNYGSIGAVIGHEISHGFDDEGSQYDGDGRLRDWWTADDRKAFEAIADRLVAQFDSYEPIPGKHVNGRLTLGENIADLSGLQIAFKAYERSLSGKPSPVIGGYTGEQRFFLGWSQAWRVKAREQRLMQNLLADPHAPGEFRANGAAQNHDGFHQAFDTKEGDKMFKPSEARIRIW